MQVGQCSFGRILDAGSEGRRDGGNVNMLSSLHKHKFSFASCVHASCVMFFKAHNAIQLNNSTVQQFNNIYIYRHKNN